MTSSASKIYSECYSFAPVNHRVTVRKYFKKYEKCQKLCFTLKHLASIHKRFQAPTSAPRRKISYHRLILEFWRFEWYLIKMFERNAYRIFTRVTPFLEDWNFPNFWSDQILQTILIIYAKCLQSKFKKNSVQQKPPIVLGFVNLM